MKIASIVLLLACMVASAGYCKPLFLPVMLQSLRALNESHQMSYYNNEKILRQTTEFTCGPAAVASLANFYFGDTTTEEEIAEQSGMFKSGAATLLGLQNACLAKGYKAIGYKMTLPQLMREVDTSNVPVIVHFQTPTLHYALVTGMVDDYVLVSDPSMGNLSMDVDDFLRRWSNKALVVNSETRPVNRVLVSERKESAAVRLSTLRCAGRLMYSLR